MTERTPRERACTVGQSDPGRLLEIYIMERRLMAFEIHDGFIQHAIAVLMRLQALQDMTEQDYEGVRREINTAIVSLGRAIDEARHMISGLRPPLLEELGVVPAVEHLVSQMRETGEVAIELLIDGDLGRLTAPLENAVYRIVQESLTNAVRHSKSRNIEVRLTRRCKRLQVEVEDWGIGFDLEAIGENQLGLEGIRQRAALLGGRVTIKTAAREGSRVTVDLPLIAEELKGNGDAS